MKPFEYLKEILNSKKYNLVEDEEFKKDYVPFLINRGVSYYKDCIFHANEMNIRNTLDNKLQYDFFFHDIRKYKRPFVKWEKTFKDGRIPIIKKRFNCSNSKAKELLNIITEDQFNLIEAELDTGGI
jgi:hypothetical protein